MSEFRVGIGVHEGDVYTTRQADLNLCAHNGRTNMIFTYTTRQADLGLVSKGEREKGTTKSSPQSLRTQWQN